LISRARAALVFKKIPLELLWDVESQERTSSTLGFNVLVSRGVCLLLFRNFSLVHSSLTSVGERACLCGSRSFLVGDALCRVRPEAQCGQQRKTLIPRAKPKQYCGLEPFRMSQKNTQIDSPLTASRCDVRCALQNMRPKPVWSLKT